MKIGKNAACRCVSNLIWELEEGRSRVQLLSEFGPGLNNIRSALRKEKNNRQ